MRRWGRDQLQISCRSAAVAAAVAILGRKTRCRLFKPRGRLGLCQKLRIVPGCPRFVSGSGKTPWPPRGILCKQDDQDSKMIGKLALQEHMRYIESLRQLLRGQLLPHA